MSAKQKLRNALSAIDDAKRALKRAKLQFPEDINIRRALREIDDAETDVERAIREIED